MEELILLGAMRAVHSTGRRAGGCPAWKVQLKEATPALSERERSSTASSELPEQQR